MANHIQNLTAARDDAQATIAAAELELVSLMAYLSSPKFYEDNTVQIRTDLYPKLMALRSTLMGV